MEIYNQLITNGYYIGKSTEIFSPFELAKIRKSIQSDIKISFTENNNNDWLYFLTCAWKNDLNKDDHLNKPVSFEKIQEKLDYIKQNDGFIQQSWFFKSYTALKDVPLFNDVVEHKLKNYVSKIYNIKYDDVEGSPMVTYYRKNDFISVHRDGKNERRICGMLIYFATENDYKKEYGGRLLLSPADEQTPLMKPEDYHLLDIGIEPTAPNMVVLDFTKHNIYHAVEKCTKDFFRTAFIIFFTLRKSSLS